MTYAQKNWNFYEGKYVVWKPCKLKNQLHHNMTDPTFSSESYKAKAVKKGKITISLLLLKIYTF